MNRGSLLRIILLPVMPVILGLDWLIGKLPGEIEVGDIASDHCEEFGCEPCGCGNQPPYHCMFCCRDFNSEEVS